MRRGDYLMDNTTKYRDIFFDESEQYLTKLNDRLLQFEKTPDDISILEDIFRVAHSFKGMTSIMGYDKMTELIHRMENVFELFRNPMKFINSDVISLNFRCLDKLSEIMEDLKLNTFNDFFIDDLLVELDNVVSANNISNKTKEDLELYVSFNQISDIDYVVIHNAQEKNYNAYVIAIKLSSECLLKGARSLLVVIRLEQHGDILHSEPSPDRLEEGDFDDIFKLIYLTKLDEKGVRDIVVNISEVDEILIHTILNEDSIASRVYNDDTKEVEVIENNLDNFLKVNIEETVDARNNLHQTNQYIRVDLNKVDVIMDLTSELVIHRTRLEDICHNYENSEINEPISTIARLTSELQAVVSKIRMMPINIVFDRFPRMIRDLSKKLNKKIDLIIEGDEIELDGALVSEIGEPLVHLLRNAADHGIESPTDRLSLGKSEVGTIKLTAYQNANSIVITVSDDGKGIDPLAIRDEATIKGIFTQGIVDRDLIQLIFNQGFSTVKSVNNISGRGVGMDAVKKKITSLGGNVKVISEINNGTSFIIELPLTLMGS